LASSFISHGARPSRRPARKGELDVKQEATPPRPRGIDQRARLGPPLDGDRHDVTAGTGRTWVLDLFRRPSRPASLLALPLPTTTTNDDDDDDDDDDIGEALARLICSLRRRCM